MQAGTVQHLGASKQDPADEAQAAPFVQEFSPIFNLLRGLSSLDFQSEQIVKEGGGHCSSASMHCHAMLVPLGTRCALLQMYENLLYLAGECVLQQRVKFGFASALLQ